MLSLQVLKESLAKMVLIRRFEEHSVEAYTQGHIGGFCHLCIGQEAIPVALSLVMSPQDSVITAYRAHGIALTQGLSPRQVMAELMGKEAGCSRGKGGSMHMFNVSKRFYGGHGIVGSSSSLGTGLALAHRYSKDNGVSLTLLGDGASNQGQFFESMNMASLWNLPVLYIIENNGFSMGTSVERGCAGGPLYKRGEPFGIPGALCLGDDFIELHQQLRERLEIVRETSRPFLLEIDTYRFKGHSMSDPGKYRTRETLDEARTLRDPIQRLQEYLIQEHHCTPEALRAFDEYAQDCVKDAVAFSLDAEEPPQEALWKDVFVTTGDSL